MEIICDICGFRFSNLRQFGPHRRRCLQKGGSCNDGITILSRVSSTEDGDTIITEPVVEGDPPPPTPLHLLAQRPPAPWGQSRTIVQPREDDLQVDNVEDLQEVCWLGLG